MIGEISTKPKGSLDIVNGIIEEYKANSGTIDANSFVEFVDNYTDDIIHGSNYKINSYSSESFNLSVTKLDENRVFIAYGFEDVNSNICLYGVVCKVSNTAISYTTSTLLSSTLVNVISVTTLSNNKVFIAYSSRDSRNIYGVVCDISEYTITVGIEYSILTSTNDTYIVNAVSLSNSKVFIAHDVKNNSVSYILYGIVCTISGTTITIGTDIQISSDSHSAYHISISTLSSSKVFITHTNNYQYSYYRLDGIVCTISNTNITVGTNTIINNLNVTKTFSVTTLSSSKVFIAYNLCYSSAYNMYAVVCTISGTTITVGTDVSLLDATYYYTMLISVTTLSESKVFVTYAYNYGTTYSGAEGFRYILYAVICDISGTTITKYTNTGLHAVNPSYAISTVALNENRVFVAHRYYIKTDNVYSLYAIVAGRKNDKSIKPSTTKIEGITKTQATTTTEGKVYVLDT